VHFGLSIAIVGVPNAKRLLALAKPLSQLLEHCCNVRICLEASLAVIGRVVVVWVAD
jgi:hypothetical protein